jgi:hypothetical protein
VLVKREAHSVARLLGNNCPPSGRYTECLAPGRNHEREFFDNYVECSSQLERASKTLQIRVEFVLSQLCRRHPIVQRKSKADTKGLWLKWHLPTLQLEKWQHKA